MIALPGLAHAAAVYSTDFSTFTPGDVQGQQGWGYPVNSPTVGTIVSTPAGAPAGAGAQSLQFQETTQQGLFGVANGVNGPRVTPAGETGTSTADGVAAANNHFFATFLYRTPASLVAPSPGGALIAFNPASSSLTPLATSVGQVATRYAFFGLVGNTDPQGQATPGVSFVIGSDNDTPNVVVYGNVAANTWYQITESLTFVDGLNGDGSPNDVFSVSVRDANGTLLGTGTGQDWEDGYRDPSFAGTNRPLAVDTMDFLNRFGPAGQIEGAITNLTYGTDTVTTPEPASLAVLGTAVAGLAALRRRRRSR